MRAHFLYRAKVKLCPSFTENKIQQKKMYLCANFPFPQPQQYLKFRIWKFNLVAINSIYAPLKINIEKSKPVHVCACMGMCAHVLGLRHCRSVPGVWAHFAAGSFLVQWLRQQARLRFHEASSCLKAGHRAKSGVFQRLIKALTNASLHHFSDY